MFRDEIKNRVGFLMLCFNVEYVSLFDLPYNFLVALFCVEMSLCDLPSKFLSLLFKILIVSIIPQIHSSLIW